jgi:hypothetical protein
MVRESALMELGLGCLLIVHDRVSIRTMDQTSAHEARTMIDLDLLVGIFLAHSTLFAHQTLCRVAYP